jgi:hypothetical protein
MAKKEKYTLIGVDGNAFAIMGYTADAMEKEGFSEEEVNKMYEEAESGNYYHLIAICNKWIRKVNEKASQK